MSTRISCVGSFDSSLNFIDAKIPIAWLFHNLYIVCASIHWQNQMQLHFGFMTTCASPMYFLFFSFNPNPKIVFWAELFQTYYVLKSLNRFPGGKFHVPVTL